MFGLGKKTDQSSETIPETSVETTNKPGLLDRLKKSLIQEEAQSEDQKNSQPVQEKADWLTRLKRGLSRTREDLAKGLEGLFSGHRVIDQALLEEVETRLLTADVGVAATQTIINELTARVSRKELADMTALFQALQQNMQAILQPVEQPLIIPQSLDRPFVILMVGVNGTGKTTTIGKLAKRFRTEGRSVMLAAGDTFRAAAVEQLKVWGERNEIPVIAQLGKADSAAVIFDALQAATARKVEILIADTAGRLHTQGNLMEELKKVKRVINKLDPQAPHETMLVIDGGTGQNALSQAQQFHQAVGLNGITVTKLDGTAKGGIVFAVAQQMKLPIRFIGVGEQLDDLRSFSAANFVEALLSRD